MNDLVKRLSATEQPVTVNRPNNSPQALKERIDLGYLHVLFTSTGTELCVRLNKLKCVMDNADFEKGKGTVSVEGAITLNYEKVKCKVEIDIATMEGRSVLQPVDDFEYDQLMKA